MTIASNVITHGDPNGLQVAIARRADATLDSLSEAQQAGAIEDFQGYIDQAKVEVGSGIDKESVAQREEWIATLKAGGQPIADDVLKQLREAEQ